MAKEITFSRFHVGIITETRKGRSWFNCCAFSNNFLGISFSIILLSLDNKDIIELLLAQRLLKIGPNKCELSFSNVFLFVLSSET